MTRYRVLTAPLQAGRTHPTLLQVALTALIAQAWHLLAIFVATIVGIVTQPLPLGAVAMLGLGAAQLTKVLTFSQAFSAFSSEIPCALGFADLGRESCTAKSAARLTKALPFSQAFSAFSSEVSWP